MVHIQASTYDLRKIFKVTTESSSRSLNRKNKDAIVNTVYVVQAFHRLFGYNIFAAIALSLERCKVISAFNDANACGVPG